MAKQTGKVLKKQIENFSGLYDLSARLITYSQMTAS
jgi:hypothetical protein